VGAHSDARQLLALSQGPISRDRLCARRLTLDIGCGEGRLSRDLKALGHTIVALDSSPTMVKNARQADPSIQVHVANAAKLPLADAAADLAIAFMSLQDMDDMPAAIREAARVLEPGGRFCLAVVHPVNSAGTFAGEEAAVPLSSRAPTSSRSATPTSSSATASP
jgi:ubiquinone/menaquinone biosynthesis C-methylase UbiE